MVILHGAGGTTGGDGTESGYVTEHFGEGNLSLHDASTAAAAFHAFHLSATLVQVTNHVTHVFFGSNHLKFHDGLHEDGTCLRASILVCLQSGDFEGELVRVHGVERTVKKFNLEAVKRIATEDTALHGVFKAFLNRGNEFLGDVTAGHLVLELQATFLEVFVHGTHVHDDVSELTTTTGLLLVNLAEVDGLGDGFLVVHLGLTLVIMGKFESRTALKLVQKYKISFVVGVPTVLEELADEQMRQGYDLTTLKGIVTMGSPLERSACIRYQKVLTPNIFNGYGTTETFWNTFGANIDSS